MAGIYDRNTLHLLPRGSKVSIRDKGKRRSFYAYGIVDEVTRRDEITRGVILAPDALVSTLRMGPKPKNGWAGHRDQTDYCRAQVQVRSRSGPGQVQVRKVRN